MILYNVTIKIEHSVHRQWLTWMQTNYLPAMLKTGQFREYTISRLLGTDEAEGFTYSIQYLANSFSDYQIFQEKYAAKMQRKMQQEFEGKYVVFRTVMKVIERKGDILPTSAMELN